MSGSAAAYSAGARAWADGPERVYGELARLLVACAPESLVGRRVLDLGSGTGAASRPAVEAGARVVAIDAALGMLQRTSATRPPAMVGDARSLPLRDGALDAVVAAFCLNHLEEPAEGVREVGRVTRAGGHLLASTYARDDDHPVKDAVERALSECGWQRPEWYGAVRGAMAAWGTVDDATAVIEAGGMEPVAIERRLVPFPDLPPAALVAWRLGMAQCASFVAGLDDEHRQQVSARALELLGADHDPLVRRVIFIVARAR